MSDYPRAHHHTVVVLSIVLLLVVGLLIALMWQSPPPLSQTALTQPDPNQKDSPVVTIVSSERATYTPPPQPTQATQEPAATPPRLAHSSDILARVDTPEDQFFATLDPNDSYYPHWHHTALGLPTAWDVTTGSSDVIIAVIDSGFALGHQDLSAAWHINAGEQGTTSAGQPCWTGTPANKQTNNCDDDSNGYVDDWRGWDFSGLDNDPQAGAVDPNGSGVGHGSLVAGLVGARGNNAIGIAGANWQAQIMPLQALSDTGSGYTSDIVAAIEYAVDNGADVINLSLGGPSNNYALYLAVSYARSQDVYVVASSGNCATLSYSFCGQLDAPGYMGYPAKYDELLSVGATSSSGTRASFSSYGPELDVVAPGQGIGASTHWTLANPTNSYTGGISGTSFSAPLTSGAIGLLRGLRPELTVNDIDIIIRQTAEQPTSVTGLFDEQYGYGQIRVDDLLAVANSNSATNLSRTTTDQPLLGSSSGQNPAAPLGIAEQLSTTATSFSGDILQIIATNSQTNTTVTLGEFKTGDDGQQQFSWNTRQLGQGIWQIRAHGLQLVSLAETLYIGQ